MFEADEIHLILKSSQTQFRAMILLGVNYGFGNYDCGLLPLSAVDLRACLKRINSTPPKLICIQKKILRDGMNLLTLVQCGEKET